MSKSATAVSLFVITFVGSVSLGASETSDKPLRETELLALVAGGVLSENIANEIAVRGLAFRPDDFYRTQLKTAEADAKVLAALDAPKVNASGSSESTADKEQLMGVWSMFLSAR